MKIFSSQHNDKLVDIAMLVIRLFIGLSMLTHGYPKLQKLMSNVEIDFMDFLGLGPIITIVLVVFAEVICSVLIILGLMTRLSSIILIFTMLIAAFVRHGGEPFSGKELALMYLVFYIILLIIGPGKFSLDRLFTKKEIRY